MSSVLFHIRKSVDFSDLLSVFKTVSQWSLGQAEGNPGGSNTPAGLYLSVHTFGLPNDTIGKLHI